MAKIRPKTNKQPQPPGQDCFMTKNLDALAEFEEFKESLLPVLQADLRKKTPAKEILEKLKTLAAVRLGHIVMTEVESNKALSAIKDILDRTDGRAVERSETTHKFEKLKDEELDSLLQSRLKEVSESDEDEKH